MTIAVIDVGSNAVRMALGSGNRSGIQVIKSFRAPIRLGSDVFSVGKISDENIARLVDAFKLFQDIIRQSKVSDTFAIATSAVRDCSNKKQLVETLKRETGIELRVIDEKEEARLIHVAVSAEVELSKKKALITDIGGGSVEFVRSHDRKIKDFISLRLGTVRLSQSLIQVPPSEHLPFLRSEVSKALKKLGPMANFFGTNPSKKLFVGTGGNVRTLHRLSKEFFRNPKKESIALSDFERLTRLISTYTYEERIKELDLRKDRADVILPAMVILEETMKLLGFNEIRTPKVGLKDGLLFDQVRKALKK